MSDQAYINSLYRSAANYKSQASYWRGQASAAQSTIDALNPQLAHKREQLGYANEVNSRFPSLDTAIATMDSDINSLATALSTQLEDNGANSQITMLDDTYTDHATSAKNACSQLIEQLQQEIASLEQQIAAATSQRNTAQANASTASANASWCYSRISALS
ncbi:hypothetical protein [Olsenella sp. Marseille-QA0557]|uniref:Uncharacterized protein n=1 Tax=Candidatus Coprovicinus avistercoris TaxID=2840754 RepID=A0A9D1L4C9_9ACTN|nr:hypothetical protein [Candidatus Coprovicinus avistercoris]